VDDLLSEKEQLEQIRSWWSEYGGYVIGGLGLGIAVLAGNNYYQNSKLEAQLEGSAMYESLTRHVVSGSLEEAEVVASELGEKYADTSYAAQAKLAMARLYMDKNRDQDAIDVLSELLANPADEAIKNVARARLARLLPTRANRRRSSISSKARRVRHLPRFTTSCLAMPITLSAVLKMRRQRISAYYLTQ